MGSSLSLFFSLYCWGDVGLLREGRGGDRFLCNGPHCEKKGKQWHRLSRQRQGQDTMLLLEFPFSWCHSCDASDAEHWWSGGAQSSLSGPPMHEWQAQRVLQCPVSTTPDLTSCVIEKLEVIKWGIPQVSVIKPKELSTWQPFFSSFYLLYQKSCFLY